MATVYFFGKMEGFIKDVIKTIKSIVLESILNLKEKDMKDFGIMVFRKD